MTSVSVSVPGKAVLSGEYAVLRTAPALSAAIDCRAVARIETTNNGFHSVSTPGHAPGQWRFTANDAGEIEWLDALPKQGLELIEAAWSACVPAVDDYLDVTVDTTAFFAPRSGQKFGLGGSAAAMTALIGALLDLDSRRERVFALARAAHKTLQGGLGSGVDIATSFYGGVIEFRSGSASAPLRHPWPAKLACRLLWSGKPADTKARIRNLSTRCDGDKSWSLLSDAAEAAALAWKGHEVQEILRVFDRYTDTLRQFGIDHDLGIFDAGHDALRNIATNFAAVYKPCGAGGGDIGIVLAADENAINEFCDAAETLGFVSLDASVDPVGIRFLSGGGH